MSALVFISHSSQDNHVAIKVCEALERRGLACWLASRDIHPGENFQEDIVKAIRSVRVMVLVFTGHANNSNEIKKEVALASQNHLVIIPLRLEDVLPSDAFLYELSTRQWIDAFDDWDRAIGRLADQISAVTGEAVTAPTLPEASTKRGRMVWYAAAAAVVLLVAGGIAYWFSAGPAAPTMPAASATAAARNISGKWVSGSLINPYDKNQKSILHFDFSQTGGNLLGTVSEQSDFGNVPRGIQGGRVDGAAVVFYTQGVTMTGNDQQTYKENYQGTLKEREIEFIRQNDVASGGIPEKFTARPE